MDVSSGISVFDTNQFCLLMQGMGLCMCFTPFVIYISCPTKVSYWVSDATNLAVWELSGSMLAIGLSWYILLFCLLSSTTQIHKGARPFRALHWATLSYLWSWYSTELLVPDFMLGFPS